MTKILAIIAIILIILNFGILWRAVIITPIIKLREKEKVKGKLKQNETIS